MCINLSEQECKALLNAIRTRKRRVKDLGYTAYVQHNEIDLARYDAEFINLNNVADKLFSSIHGEEN